MRAFTVFVLTLMTIIHVALAAHHPTHTGRGHDLSAGGHHCGDEDDGDDCSWECKKECIKKPPSQLECVCPKVLPGGTTVNGTFLARTIVASEVDTSYLSCASGSNYIHVTCPLALPEGTTALGDLTVAGEIIAKSAEISGTIDSANIVNTGAITTGTLSTTALSTSTLTVGGQSCSCSALGSGTVAGDLTVGGEIIANSAEISGTIDSANIVNTGAITTSSLSTTILSTSTLTVGGQSCSCSALGSGTVAGDLTVGGEIIANSAEISGTIDSANIVNTGAITTGSLATTGDLTVGGTVTANDVQVTELTCNGVSSIDVTCDLHTTDIVNSGNLVVGNQISAVGLTVTGNANVFGTLGTNDITCLNGGPLDIGCTTGVNVAGPTTVAGPLTVTGAASAGSLFVGGVPCSCSSAVPQTTQWAYIYNIGAQTIGISDPVSFSSVGTTTPEISFTAGGSPVKITTVAASVYMIFWSTSSVGVSQFALFLNGNPLADTVYGAGTGTVQNNGFVIAPLGAGPNFITLVNYKSTAAVALQVAAQNGGSEPPVNAAMLLVKLA